MRNLALKIALFAALAGCGELSEGVPLAQLSRGIIGAASGLIDSDTPAQTTANAELSRAAIEASPTNLLRLSIISLEATDVLAEIGRNGNDVTWANSASIGVTFQNGLLIATRGLGFDVMGADVKGAYRSLSGGGNHMRKVDFLDGLDQIQQLDFQCQTAVIGRDVIVIYERSYDTTILEETCSSTDLEFKNTYWRDRNDVIWQSRQWISPEIGYLGYQLL